MSQPTSPPNPGDLHEDQITELLRSGAHAALLITYFGELHYRELSELARLAATRRNPRGHTVFILPGVMGSRLALVKRGAAHLLWLHPHALHAGEFLQLALPGSRSIKAVGVMLPGYLKLKLWLEIAGFRAIFHPFDWRVDVERSARQFVRTLEMHDVSSASIVGHSMGGLVARAALAHDSAVRIKRVVQLGTPNGGSFAPLQALRAVYPTVRKIACLDPTRSAEEFAQHVFHTFDGLYQMLPTAAAGDAVDVFDAAHWPNDELAPNAKRLAQARRLRARLPDGDERCAAIVGVNQDTIVALARGAEGFEYELRAAGDGTVPVQRAQWPGARSFYVAENHGVLTQNRDVLTAVIELLKDGDTQRLSASAPPFPSVIARRTCDAELRRHATRKVSWDALSSESRRRILEPVITPEFVSSP